MAVNWNWKRKMGTIYCKNSKDQKYKLNMYAANCLCAILYEYKDTETKENMYQFITFFNDFEHLKRCIGLAKTQQYNYETKKPESVYDNLFKNEWKKIKLNIAYKDMAKMGELLAKAGFKVELYYKEVK